MKINKTLLLFIFVSSIGYSQPLQVGVPVTVTLATDWYTVWPVPGCYMFEYGFSHGDASYASGMTTYLRIDSITGSCDSMQIYRTPDYIYRVVHANDTIPITTSNYSHNMIFYPFS